MVEPKELALMVAKTALDKHAEALEILHVEGKVSYTDYIVICQGRSSRQVGAIVEEVERVLKKAGVIPLGVEGRAAGQWVLMDLGDVVFHVFEESARRFYDLDGLWIDAERTPVPARTEGPSS